jgi:2-C-methyl-D-erythritol 4-phosphate cytidylyltransferase / 2-C-methyl-D-erythritol 2,4-cyclodiphosphate synthase
VSIAALIVAAGRGTRAHSGAHDPKQYQRLGNRSVLAHTVAAFEAHPQIAMVQIVIHADDRALYAQSGVAESAKVLPPVTGGVTRQDSVRLGLQALKGLPAARVPGHVLIHDAARPFVSAQVIDRVVGGLAQADGCIAGLPVADTLKRAAENDEILQTVGRDGLWRAQTPQGFALDSVFEAHEQALRQNKTEATDDAQIAEWAGLNCVLALGSEQNIKLTSADDMRWAQQRLERQPTMIPRLGNGFDVHAFGAGDHVWLCGVKVAHTHGLVGHSDADVGLHALTDAIYGALGDGDIGSHFPPTDAQWKGASSDGFLAAAADAVRQRGAQLVNVDVTLICEAPKIGPHRSVMVSRVADILGLSGNAVSVKATTTEGLGFAGRQEGIAALATATVLHPPQV